MIQDTLSCYQRKNKLLSGRNSHVGDRRTIINNSGVAWTLAQLSYRGRFGPHCYKVGALAFALSTFVSLALWCYHYSPLGRTGSGLGNQAGQLITGAANIRADNTMHFSFPLHTRNILNVSLSLHHPPPSPSPLPSHSPALQTTRFSSMHLC